MSGYESRIPASEAYVRRLGRAVYNFTYLEHSIVWLGETMSPGFINSCKKSTAKIIANKFESVVESTALDNDTKQKLATLSTEFKELVKVRDKILHSRPYTTEDGEQELLYDGRHGRMKLVPEELEVAAQGFETAAIAAGRLLHESGLLERHRGNLARTSAAVPSDVEA